MKSSIIAVDGVAAVVKESIVAVTVVAVALGGIVERVEDVAAEAIGEIAVEEKVVNVVVAVDVVDSEAIVGVVTGPNRQVALTPHYLSHLPCSICDASFYDEKLKEPAKLDQGREHFPLYGLPML